jgi:CxxC motif-containing protein (DUF1111 family)
MSARRKSARPIVAIALALLLPWLSLPAYAQSSELAGGDLTAILPRDVLLELPAPSVNSDADFSLHLEGHSVFHRSFRTISGSGRPVLGPLFNNDSCSSCHVRVGRGPIQLHPSTAGSTMIVKVGARTRSTKQAAPSLPGIGEQLQDRSLDGSSRFAIRLRWKSTTGAYPDGENYSLRRPQLSLSLPRYHQREFTTSLRMTPQVIGMGLLEAISSERILSLADPDDRDGDGISGRATRVLNRETKAFEVGRFGFKATHPTLKQQTAAALFHDMGITTEMFKKPARPPELSNRELLSLVFYQQVSGVPGQRAPLTPDVVTGRELFQSIGCTACHVPHHQTSSTASPHYLASQAISPYTDLLVHDMGPGLADGRTEFGVSGREWRTAPLWGLGMYEVISPRNTGFLHDGRARTLSEAILWHGGEASSSRAAFVSLSALQRAQIISFLRSL